MKNPRELRWLRAMLFSAVLPTAILFSMTLLATAETATAQTATAHIAEKQTAANPATVLMLSDIHFDPFHDPAKLGQLQASPVEAWTAILEAPASPTQAADFAHLQTTCGARGSDTPIELLQSSLAAAEAQGGAPMFVTVSGDLMAHQFDCRFNTLAANATAAGLSAFAAKTVAFVALRLHQTFPRTPVYLALGNNDSGCKDYREDTGSLFLHAAAASFAGDVLSSANREAILKQFPEAGDYSVALPAPMRNARLIVLQDVFESKHYAGCKGDASDAPAEAQIAWLRAQLGAARAAHENVWVMGHIPPGVDAYSTLTGAHDVCGGQPPTLFINNPSLVEALTGFADVVRLALFAHTHMDEMRLLRSDGSEAVAAKLVPSISPVDGNNPAFTLAEVDPGTATLKDYAVYAADNKTGVGTVWSLEYRYSTAYGLPDFTSASLASLTSGMIADKAGTSAASRNYQRFYFVGLPGSIAGKSALMQLVWPGYACTLSNTSPAGYRACLCPATGPGAGP